MNSRSLSEIAKNLLNGTFKNYVLPKILALPMPACCG